MPSIISYNIRYNNPADGVNAWPYRSAGVAELLQRYQPDLIGLQEVRHEQLLTLIDALPTYSWLGVGRDDGATEGEYAPIFYQRERFTVEDHGYFWLSETPDQIGSFGWDAACVRIATWAIFLDVTTNKRLLHLNTHFDHRGLVAQHQSTLLLQRFLVKQAVDCPAIITGDFNCAPNSATYRALTTPKTTDIPALQDTMYISTVPHQGPAATFTTDFADPLQEKIDYIFLYNGTASSHQLTVTRHAILTDQESGYYPSDHLPVLVEVE